MAFEFKSKKSTAQATPAPPKSHNFYFGPNSNREPAKSFEEMNRKRCQKCGAPMSTGGTSRWVCLVDGTAAA